MKSFASDFSETKISSVVLFFHLRVENSLVIFPKFACRWCLERLQARFGFPLCFVRGGLVVHSSLPS